MNRRALLAALLATSIAPILTACETVKEGDTTTHILNVSKVKAYATAGLNAASMVASALALNPAFLPAALKVREIAAILSNDLEVFNQAVGGELTISYNDYNWKTLVDTLLTDLERLLGVINSTVVVFLTEILVLNDSTVGKIKVVYDALNTLVSIFKALVGGFITTASGPNSLTEAEALAILKS